MFAISWSTHRRLCRVLTSYLPARIIMPARIAAGIRVDDSKGRQSGFSEDRESIRERG
jgi:hypothetical protein